MKKIMVLMCLAGLGGFILSGCALGPYAPGIGYSNLQGPVTSTGNAAGPKKGTAQCVNYAGVYAAGDASIATAAKNGKIRRIQTVDYEMINYSPFYIKTTTIVTGD
jgi:hypothetical protein